MVESPSRGRPGPARDDVVDDRSPEERNDEDRGKTSALGASSDSDDRSEGGEHGLVEGVEENGHFSGSLDVGVHESEEIERPDKL